jgi:hypothetical protein
VDVTNIVKWREKNKMLSKREEEVNFRLYGTVAKSEKISRV